VSTPTTGDRCTSQFQKNRGLVVKSSRDEGSRSGNSASGRDIELLEKVFFVTCVFLCFILFLILFRPSARFSPPAPVDPMGYSNLACDHWRYAAHLNDIVDRRKTLRGGAL
jgi:hypothetical protein